MAIATLATQPYIQSDYDHGWPFRSQTFLQRYCTFQRNEPCSPPVTVEMIAAYLKKTPEEIALATTFNALKVFGLST